MAIEDFKCPLPKIESVEKWVQRKPTDENDCPPCLIAPLSSYYLGALNEAGEGKLAEELKEVFNSGDILTIARKLDSIKSEVGEALKNELKDLDCFAQVFKPQQDEADSRTKQKS